MRLHLPWWLSPWREVRLRTEAMDSLSDQVARLTGIEAGLMTERARLSGQLEDAQRRLRQLHGGTPEGVMASPPEFVLVGIDRGAAGKRLIASRDLPGAAFGMTGMDDPPPRFQIRAVLARPLFIDSPDYATALDRMRAIWMNWDKAATGGLPIEPPARGAIEP